ncbi:G-type lectin S-receptor-like serine/threonine-protein kinase At1g61500 isoform X1 [Pyrus x bretschneideri]|uniref:G-type lectin S-receptor-like serine/threonine-protein kinase At1g61500 isoform X1 n=1 Tax=Pyrus x bretschneideri TaxID=225117 RepID=UPI002030D89B|nr:G-type lectin S-receptor-like serine/threonine-protein kinase At1g61500 isoform X1 [Pyrus x bretschneideri]
MHSFLLQSLFPFLLIASFLSINVELSLCQDDAQFTNCSSSINCGGVGNISYPFYGVNRATYCGQPGYEVQCLNNVPVINMTGLSFRILEMNSTTAPRTVSVARLDYWSTICPLTFVNTTLNFSLFNYASGYTNMTFYYLCDITYTGLPREQCNINKTVSPVFYGTRSMVEQTSSVSCTDEVIVPVYTAAAQAIEASQTTIGDAVKGGFPLELEIDSNQCNKCEESGGQCGLNNTINSGFSCFCPDQAYASICNGTSNSSQNGGKGKPIKLIVSLTVVCFIGVLGAIVFGLCRMRAKQKGHIKITRKHIKMTRDTLQEYIGGKHDLSELLIYDFDSILVATDNFSIENKLGQGGFGPVYWGKLAEGKEIAVKRLSSTSGQGVVEFKNEMLLISNLQHKNLVRIMGCCVKEDEKLLIYEFMPNKSLDTFLFDSTRRAVLDWGTRFNIIQGVAKGLVYLHHDSYLKVIHRDLKVSNILLDEKMNPKISDFGLARSIEGTQNLENTQRVAGTRGYMSPEYAMGGIFSQKSDVYSFGVLVLEIISSKKNTAFYIYDRQLGLLAYAWQLWKEGRELELVDEMLAADSYSASEVMKCVHIGLLCVQDNAMDRPSMPDVVFMLNGSTTIIGGAQPKQPLFTIQNTVSHPQPQPSNTFLTNEATMTLIEGR